MGRSQLQAVLETVVPNVYFQPPADLVMTYPCIVYQRDAGRTDFADNYPYRYQQRYQVELISRDPDSVEARAKLTALPSCLFNRYFSANKLHHDVFIIYHGGVEE